MSAKAGHEVLKTPSVFANAVHCLSHTQFHYAERAPTILYRSVSDDVRKHIDMLDGIALLITIGTEKMVATGLIRNAGVTQIVWATNSSRPATLDAAVYIHQLIEKMKDQEEIRNILSYVIPWCKLKIVARAKKLAKIFDLTEKRLREGESNLLGLREGITAGVATEPQARRKGLLKPDVKFSKAGDLFLRQAARLSKDSSTEEIISVLVSAWKMATKVPNLKNNLSAQQWRRLRKLSDYTQACIRYRYHAKELGGEKALIVQKQIFPPQEGKVSVNGSTIAAVNTFVEEFSQHQPLTDFAAQIQKYYPEAREGSSINEEVEFSQHCEITVAQYLLEHGSGRRIAPIEVGCSKASCFWCNLYFECLNDRLPARCGVLTSATHGKLCDGWMLPAEPRSLEYKGQKITDEINKEVMDFIGEQMDLMFARGLGQRRKSDSVPLDGVRFSDEEMGTDEWLNAPLPSEESEM